jgi:FixJ family two-component response regulator
MSTSIAACDGPPAATVFIVDDDPVVRRAVQLLVRSIGLADECYATAHDFLQQYDPSRPGCLVLDIRMPGMTGLELQKSLIEYDVKPPIVFITAHGEIPCASQAFRKGAIDFIQKPFSPQMLLERIREALKQDHDNRHKRSLARAVLERIARLTDREREIMEMLSQGDTTKQIAQRLSISSKTVDNHRARVLEKMNVDNPTQLARLLAAL